MSPSSSPSGDDPIGFGKADVWRNPLKKSSHTSIFVPKSKPITNRPTDYRYPSNHASQPKPQFSSLHPGAVYQPAAVAPSKPKPAPAQTANDDDGEFRFDADAALRSENSSFGAPDPYAYVDADKASDNIKTLLEGAFDDEEDKSRTRLRRRAKRTVAEEKEIRGLSSRLAALDVKKDDTKKGDEDNNKDEEEEEEEEDGTVEGLTVKLLPHQVDGVSWMIDRETGIGKRNGAAPRGGILADDMGLGKTVQSVALILTNPRPAPDAVPEHPKQKLPGRDVAKCTLVVAPLALIKQWEAEIAGKVARTHALKVLVHHGSSRTKAAADLLRYDVVITTFQTLTAEHAASDLSGRPGARRVGCFGVYWYRVMLDEAHSIKNRNAKSTQACYALGSWYRWCLTGTPMQNNLDELQSLIQFLQIKPYCQLPEWKAQIIQPMKSGRGGLAMQRLRFFLKAVMKRRTKDLLKQEGALNFGGKSGEEGATSGGMNIVKREVFTVECQFDETEQAFYDRLQDRTDQRLKDMMEEATSGGGQYMDALVLLLRLRQACNHPQLVEMALNKDKDAMTTGPPLLSGSQVMASQRSAGSDDMDDLTALMGGVSVQAKTCDVCQVKLSSDETRSGAIRCSECEDAIEFTKRPRKEKKQEENRPPKPASQQRRPRNRPIIVDSDDDDEAEDTKEDQGEWIGKGPEQAIDLGRAGGSDDEDAEGGGETLNTIDSERSDDDDSKVDDSPSRARKLDPASDDTASETDTEEDEEDDVDDKDNDKDKQPKYRWAKRDSDRSVYAGIGHSGKAKHAPSTKIRHLLRILHREAPHHKTIVFSQFTSMLDLIEPHLKASGLHFTRYDGSMRPDAREAALTSLRGDARTRVLLCSLKCGSLGLNLTAAARVVLCEPFWNPFVEEQAVDRVHRLNQTVDVRVFRLTVPDTVEERILALQEKKRELARVAIEEGAVGGGGAAGKLSMADILGLFRHDAVQGEHHVDDGEMERRFGGDGRLFEAVGSVTPGAGREVGRDSRRVGNANGKARRVVKEHEVYGRRW